MNYRLGHKLLVLTGSRRERNETNERLRGRRPISSFLLHLSLPVPASFSPCARAPMWTRKAFATTSLVPFPCRCPGYTVAPLHHGPVFVAPPSLLCVSSSPAFHSRSCQASKKSTCARVCGGMRKQRQRSMMGCKNTAVPRRRKTEKQARPSSQRAVHTHSAVQPPSGTQAHALCFSLSLRVHSRPGQSLLLPASFSQSSELARAGPPG